MGYNITVGNAVPEFDKEYFPELYASWKVEPKTLDNAPSFPGDEMTGNGNSRSPSYTVWADFARKTGLWSFFYDDRGHLHAGHPGCVGITQDDLDTVQNALNAYMAKSTLPPGFEGNYAYDGPPNYDYHLARLIWLEWWMRWAIENCETPAIRNT